ncbi:hypothetical protein SAMN03159496_03812 [Rhizobium sp. NFR07]|uniref:hypothetical protein n=1 Tax=Rhizobium sp. NFR07 TaxID=1566262 RepID=UPI0008F22987|nr:hypothetical protein [Rhizobium sp. NFR07]SFB45196.1 hypothetical protein SAMN03159496_03812 [Rhizobium sp. NFR07]
MRRFGRFHIAALLIVGLASCTTPDALTPQVDVGGGTTRSSTPVTQDDTDRMAGTYAPRTTQPSSGGYARRPQNTLEAQARALDDGNAVSPSSSGPPPDWQGNENEPIRSPADETIASAEPQVAAQPPSGGGGTIRFLPIIGAPVQAVTPLSRQLGAEARAGGLTIRPSSDSSTEQILKGYFSAFADGSKVTIVYVWDVLDNAGARLHRMQGQETLPAQGSDPWAAVPPSLMQQIATKTIRGYLAWRQTQAG